MQELEVLYEKVKLKKFITMIPITKPFMPPKDEYEKYLQGIWDREYLTNNGPLVQELESRLEKYLGIENLLFVSNGTIALQLAIQALGLEGEVITTPFSFVATTSSIVWEDCTPVFVDIDAETLNIDANLIEDAITDKTSAILATHVYGNPCDIEAIRQIADRYDLKVIYDASHCFATQYKGQSIYEFGDISTASFHATKLYHTVEGGGIITNNPDIAAKVSRMRNFGYNGPNNFEGIGINGKNSEYHAAMGLSNLKYIKEILKNRKKQWLKYESFLESTNTRSISINKNAKYNYAYYPIIFPTEAVTLKVKNALELSEIYPRRYFFPSLNKLEYTSKSRMPNSENISERVLCLPLFHELKETDQKKITQIINEFEIAEAV